MVELVVNLGIHRFSQVAVGVAEPDAVLAIHQQVFGLVVVDAVQLMGQGRGAAVGVEAHEPAATALGAVEDAGTGRRPSRWCGWSSDGSQIPCRRTDCSGECGY